ncbi:MAG: hypothetical protein P8010_01975 [Desulfosarcinaceae bacterium]|jgi:hypothetical protein
MENNSSEKRLACPHCGHENSQIADIWVSSVNDDAPVLCPKCKNALSYIEKNGLSGCEETENRRFGIRFSPVAALLPSLLIYLDWAFNEFTFRKDYGPIVYNVLIVLLISSTLASAKRWQKIKCLALWSGIFLLLMTGCSADMNWPR